jgi:hypothetical protein
MTERSSPDIVDRLRESADACEFTARSKLLAEAAGEIERLRAPAQPAPFYGATCPTYPNCQGGCGLGCRHEVEQEDTKALPGEDTIFAISQMHSALDDIGISAYNAAIWRIKKAIAVLHAQPAPPQAAPRRVDDHMTRARRLVEDHIEAYGMVPHPDRIKDAIAKQSQESFDLGFQAAGGTGPAPTPPQAAWQPIETAPKDGTAVDLWKGVRLTDCYWCSLPYAGDIPWGWTCQSLGRITNPTHWMPLPADPLSRPQRSQQEKSND